MVPPLVPGCVLVLALAVFVRASLPAPEDWAATNVGANKTTAKAIPKALDETVKRLLIFGTPRAAYLLGRLAYCPYSKSKTNSVQLKSTSWTSFSIRR